MATSTPNTSIPIQRWLSSSPDTSSTNNTSGSIKRTHHENTSALDETNCETSAKRLLTYGEKRNKTLDEYLDEMRVKYAVTPHNGFIFKGGSISINELEPYMLPSLQCIHCTAEGLLPPMKKCRLTATQRLFYRCNIVEHRCENGALMYADEVFGPFVRRNVEMNFEI